MLSPTKNWPPNYTEDFWRKQQRLLRIRQNKVVWAGAREYYRDKPIEFINHWVLTYDPRNAGSGLPARLPFLLFKRQEELVEFLLLCVQNEQNGLVEKCRDMGATWVCCAFSVWLWMFWSGASIGWGSRKEQLVDRIGDADSIFEKMRMIIRYMPTELWPIGFRPDDHMTYMRIINPENGGSITGESGDNIGRGGRKLLYFKDESSHYEHPELIEAALTDNTRVQIDISSVNGLGNVFHRKREAGVDWEPGEEIVRGKTNVFVMDWRDHPAKSQEWYNERRQRAEDEGLLHLFAQEVDRNYSASVEGTIIPAEWVESAIDAHKKLKFDDSGRWCAGLDVADAGGDRNALVKRKGVVLHHCEEWGERDTGVTTRRCIEAIGKHLPIEVQYDCIGVGAGVKAEANRLNDEKLLPKGMKFIPWNAGGAVVNPEKRVVEYDRDSPMNGDFYANLKAQGWWDLRRRFEKTHRALAEGIKYDASELISIDGKIPKLRQLQKELCQPTASRRTGNLKLIVDKMPEGTRSPNMADAVVMCYFPCKASYDSSMDWVG